MTEDLDTQRLDQMVDRAVLEQPFPRCTEFAPSDLRPASSKSSEGLTIQARSSPTLITDSDGSSEPHVLGLLPPYRHDSSEVSDQASWNDMHVVELEIGHPEANRPGTLDETLTAIGAGLSTGDKPGRQTRPGYVGLSEESVVTMSSSSSSGSDQFELRDIVVCIAGRYEVFGAKQDTAAQFNIIAEGVSQRFISSKDLIQSDKPAVQGLSKMDCPIKGRFNLTFSINQKGGLPRIGPYRAWFYVVEDQYIHDSFDALLCGKFIKKYRLLLEKADSPSLELNEPQAPLLGQIEKLSSQIPPESSSTRHVTMF